MKIVATLMVSVMLAACSGDYYESQRDCFRTLRIAGHSDRTAQDACNLSENFDPDEAAKIIQEIRSPR